jgi:hypothetical protein
MISKTLQLQRNSPERLRARRFLATGQGFQCAAVGIGVGDSRVTRESLGVVDRSFVRTASHRFLNAAMLKAEGNFQVENLFAVALKPEVPRFYDASMDRADCDLMHLVTLYAIEVADGWKN